MERAIAATSWDGLPALTEVFFVVIAEVTLPAEERDPQPVGEAPEAETREDDEDEHEQCKHGIHVARVDASECQAVTHDSSPIEVGLFTIIAQCSCNVNIYLCLECLAAFKGMLQSDLICVF